MNFEINTFLDSLPEDIEYINLRYRNLTFIPSLKRFKNLQVLICSHNQLTSLPDLNINLRKLNCDNNQLTSLPYLNENLQILICDNNKLTFLPDLNINLQKLICHNNKLTSLPYLNENLRILYCNNNPIDEIIYGIGKTRIGVNICKKQIQTLNNFIYIGAYDLKPNSKTGYGRK